ncbi:zonular occludens toxin domain-containing protein [Pseudomonas extremaustralis]|uniref:zonular occludens toxin family protein n=1 Tax=Pseudomonas TaxID=286 RepID=UPI0016555BFA|nr:MULTISPECIES: zonular occludens toxin domain-containing protein [Pseudomonas]MBC8787634.1 Zonular occludens toxin [Pseudomonas fluorescens]MDG2965632.1 zonular occludens toxin domain-containing protein [Pseudomonas extremaustralis]MDG2965644.1 zonular occludens toxin domain-containing protein [Pseudomonas extremaustralis]
MPINAYTGLMGSGKSFECVVSVIVPAVAKGRRVVTNVDGIDSDAIRAYINEKQGIALEKLGEVVHCQNEDVFKADFLPHGQPVDTFCQPGDLICIDEAWRFWGSDSKIGTEHRIFFREHRHYAHAESGVTCDLVLMVQDISDLHRILKTVVELSFRTTKIKSLGLNKIYRVEMWEGWKQTAKARVDVMNKKYDPEIFPLYSSYSGGHGKEVQVDDRQNILKNPKVWLFLFMIFFGGIGSVWGVLHFFNRGAAPATVVQQPASAAQPAANIAPPTPSQTLSTEWRIAGEIVVDGQRQVVLVNTDGVIRYEHPSNFQNSGRVMTGQLDGQRVSTFSGGKSSATSSVPLPGKNP